MNNLNEYAKRIDEVANRVTALWSSGDRVGAYDMWCAFIPELGNDFLLRLEDRDKAQQQRQADYRRVRLEVAARLMSGPAWNRLGLDDAITVAESLIAANEAMPVPAAKGEEDATQD